MAADAGVTTNAKPHLLDISAHLLRQQCHLVHKADARGQHGIGHILGEFGAAHIHHHQPVAVAQERRIQGPHQQSRLVVVATYDHPVRPHEVVNCHTLLEELRVGHHGIGQHGSALAQGSGQGLAHPVGGANWHCALVDDQLVVVHVLANRLRHGQHVLQVGRAIFSCRCAHGDKHNGAMAHSRGNIVGECKSAGCRVALQQWLQALFMDGRDTTLQIGHALCIDIHTNHAVAHFCQAGRRHQTDVTGAKHADFHALLQRVDLEQDRREPT